MKTKWVFIEEVVGNGKHQKPKWFFAFAIMAVGFRFSRIYHTGVGGGEIRDRCVFPGV